MTCEEFMAHMALRGFTVADMDKMTLGMCLNLIKATDRLKMIANGKEVVDADKQYRKLKKIQPIVEKKYASGEISEERYKEFMQSIADYETD